MACLFIVDDDADNAQQLCRLLTTASAGADTVLAVGNLADYRRMRRRYKPDLVLVELQRRRSNGFALACALMRQSAVPVVLLSDRSLQSDYSWAAARGITCVLSRLAGHRVLAAQIASLLDTGCISQTDITLHADANPSLHNAAARQQLVLSLIPPAQALRQCVAEELRSLPVSPGHWHFAANPPRWMAALQRCSNDTALTSALSRLTEQGPSDGDNGWLVLRESLLLQCQPPASACLLLWCEDEWDALRHRIQTDPGDQHLHTHRCQQLLHALAFVVQTGATDTCAQTDVTDGLSKLVRQIELSLMSASQTSQLQSLIRDACLQVLASIQSDDHRAHNMTWKHLARLCLIRSIISCRPCWQSATTICLSVLYGQHAGNVAKARDRMTRLALRLLDADAEGCALCADCRADARESNGKQHHHRAAALTELADSAGVSDNSRYGSQQLAPAVAAKLAVSLADAHLTLSRLLVTADATAAGGQSRLHKRLCDLMVAIYKLSSWLQLWISGQIPADAGRDQSPAATRSVPAVSAAEQWLLSLGVLHACVSHGVQQAGVFAPNDVSTLTDLTQQLRLSADRQHGPAYALLRDLAALELTLHGRLHADSAQEQQLLAAGLHLLPRPERIMRNLGNDISQSGTVLSEITHELILLTGGARKLGVVRVESLARLLLDCYRQLAETPALLQQKTVRLALGRAHRALCRLLDQAAAWLPLDEKSGGPDLSAVIEALFTQFGYPASESAAGADADSDQKAWLQCQSLNRRMRQLLRRSDNLSGYGSLMTELLTEQQAVITPHLPYQSPG